MNEKRHRKMMIHSINSKNTFENVFLTSPKKRKISVNFTENS